MAGPTDVLTEDVKDLRESNRQLTAEIKGVFERLSAEMRESNGRLATELRESNQRLTDAIAGLSHDFGNFRVEVARELGAIRADTARELGAVNANLEAFRARTETSFKVAVWAVTLAVGAILAGLGGAVGITWYAAKLDSRVEHVEKAIGAAEKPGTARR